MYIDRLSFARVARSGKCSACGKRVWHRGRAVIAKIVMRAMPDGEWMGIAICQKCLLAWTEKLS